MIIQPTSWIRWKYLRYYSPGNWRFELWIAQLELTAQHTLLAIRTVSDISPISLSGEEGVAYSTLYKSYLNFVRAGFEVILMTPVVMGSDKLGLKVTATSTMKKCPAFYKINIFSSFRCWKLLILIFRSAMAKSEFNYPWKAKNAKILFPSRFNKMTIHV